MFALLAQGQSKSKEVTERTHAWLGYVSQSRFSQKWGMWFDFNGRFIDLPENQFQLILRPALIYYVTDELRFMAGYCYGYNTAPKNLSTNWDEHRPWQQVFVRKKYNGFQTRQWLRFEQRFIQKVAQDKLTGDYGFNFRFRYSFMITVPLKGKEVKARIPFFVAQDEIFINAGKDIIYNYFDQNRLFIGFGYAFSDQLTFQLGYMNIFQQRPSGNEFFNNHAIRLFFFHTLDFRPKEEEVH